jgi:tetratricopeptide (TPR) repeat protein
MRKTLRAFLIILTLAIAIFLPLILSGYAELRRASGAASYVEAAEHYQAAARRLPWRADLYELAGHAYYHAGEYARADAAYQKASQRGVLSAEGWVAWGNVNYLNQNPARAVELWEQALEQPDHSERLYGSLSLIYQEQKDYAKAAEYLARYVSNHLQDASAHYRLGLLLTLSDPQTAASELITASQLDPELDPAVQTLRSAVNLASIMDAPSEQKVVIGRGLGLIQEWELALAIFEQAAHMDESNAEAWAWLGEAKQQTGGDEAAGQVEAQEYLDRALTLNPNSAVVRGLRGLYFQRVGNNREALTEFERAIVLQPDNPAWYVALGESQSKLGDLIRALEAYRYAAALTPEDATYWRLLANFCAHNNINIKDVGIPAAQQAVILTGEDAQSLDLLGWLLLLDARHPEAERILQRALAADPQNASVHFHLGMLYLQTENRTLAYQYLIQARDLGSTDAQNVLGQYFP